jgi:hypothetical protein
LALRFLAGQASPPAAISAESSIKICNAGGL